MNNHLIRAYLGGSFNPIHRGHIQLARETCELLNIRSVCLLPCKSNHLKTIEQNSVSDARVERLNKLIEKYDFLTLDYLELDSPDQHSYTIDTLGKIKQAHPGDSLVFVMGSDALLQFNHWKNWRDLLDLCNLLVFERKNMLIEPQKLNDELKTWIEQYQVNQEQFTQAVRHNVLKKLLLTPMKHPIDLSSSHLREQ